MVEHTNLSSCNYDKTSSKTLILLLKNLKTLFLFAISISSETKALLAFEINGWKNTMTAGKYIKTLFLFAICISSGIKISCYEIFFYSSLSSVAGRTRLFMEKNMQTSFVFATRTSSWTNLMCYEVFFSRMKIRVKRTRWLTWKTMKISLFLIRIPSGGI